MFTFITWLMRPKTLVVTNETTYEELRSFLVGPDYNMTVIVDTLILIGLALLVYVYISYKEKKEASSKAES